MIPGLGIAAKIVGFVLEMVVKNQIRRDELKKSFQEFFSASAKDTEVSGELHRDFERMKEELCEKENKDQNTTNQHERLS